MTPKTSFIGAVACLALAAAAITTTRITAAVATPLVISEVHPGGSGNGTYAFDWFEITNTTGAAVDIAGWRVDDNSNAFASAVALRGVTAIPAGASVVFIEGTATGTTDTTLIAAFSTAWFGSATPPAGVLIGAYGGSGIGLGAGASGDALNLFDAAGNRITGISWGPAPAGPPLVTFDNAPGAGSTTLPLPAVATTSSVGVNGAFLSANGVEIGSPGRRAISVPLSTIDLSLYVRVGRFDLPEPTRTTPPVNSVLAREVSGVTYNWDTDSLFVVGDTGTSIVQVTKTGALIDSMTLAPGGSPQGTDFYDPEGLTYVGGGRFVMSEERDRRAVLFTYVAGGTLERSAAQSVTLGTFADNAGIEGITYDPSTNGFVAVKEISPQGIFQTGIDFAVGTASNGSPSTVNSVNLFNPALAGLSDFADVYALSNLPGLTGPQLGNLLVLSQEAGQIVNIDRSGTIANVLHIASDPGNPLSVADQQHEGLTMDGNGVLYVVSENGGGDPEHPQLWVYAPSAVPNAAPTGVALENVVSTLVENTNTAARIKVADITISDDGLGTNGLAVAGADAAAFELAGNSLYVRAGTVLDFETKSTYVVSVEVDDVSVGATPDATAPYTLILTDIVDETPPPVVTVAVTEVAPWASGNSPYAADWFELTNTGSTPVDITGWRVDDDSGTFSSGVALTGVTAIAPGESAIFIETANLIATRAAFLTAWFGTSAPAGLQVGGYSGAGIGLSTGGDSVHLFDAAGNRVTGVRFGISTAGLSFDNAGGLGSSTLPLPELTALSIVGVNGAFVAADGVETGSPGRLVNVAIPPSVAVTEVAPWASSNSPYAADWFELTNTGSFPVDITGWRIDDDSGVFSSGGVLNGITVIAPGESVIFTETATLDTTRAAFRTAWFGATPPAGLQVGSYSGSGLGLSTGGDSVHIFDAARNRLTGVRFATSTTGLSFDNAARVGGTTVPLPQVSTLSVAGVNGAFLASDGIETGSPGTITQPVVLPDLIISEVVPWASGNAPYEADWFEVTNIGATPVDLTGWKMDDDSGAFLSGAALAGVTTIAPGESVIFLETADLPATRASFIAAWFGGAAPSGLQIGSYSASGVGLSTGGDSVHLFDAAGHRVTGVRFGASTTNFTFDNAAGLGATEPPLPLLATLSVATVNGAILAADGVEVGSPGSIGLDQTPPVVTVPGDITANALEPFGAAVTFTASAIDDVDGERSVVCSPVSGSFFPVGATTVTCIASDVAGNVGTASFAVSVTLAATPDAEMSGIGEVNDAGSVHHVALRVAENGIADTGGFVYWLTDAAGATPGWFETTTIASVVFTDNPGVVPGPGPSTLDTVVFFGYGRWRGADGYTFAVSATDAGEPGAQRDWLQMAIWDSQGALVAVVNGALAGGNLEATSSFAAAP